MIAARRLLLTGLAVTLLPLTGAGADEPATIEKTENVRHVHADRGYTGGAELSYADGFVYAGVLDGTDNRGQDPGSGGVRVYDVRGEDPRPGFGQSAEHAPGQRDRGGTEHGFELAGIVDCPGTDNDVSVVEPGELIAVGHHGSQCNPATEGDGMYLVDVSGITDREPGDEPVVIEAGDPEILGGVEVGSSHTITIHPTEPVAYINNGGFATADDGNHYVIDISEPADPELVAEFSPKANGCHDSQFHVYDDGTVLAFCAGLTEVQIWGVTDDPADPEVVAQIHNPAIQFPHNAVANPSGDLLVINDEAFGVHDCTTEQGLFGSLWIYDITDAENPTLQGRVNPPEGAAPAGWVGTDFFGIDGRELGPLSGWTRGWCTSHNYNFVPGTDILVSSWFTGGTTVEDLSDPTDPQRRAFYRASDSIAYTSHWFDRRVYVNDMNRGLEVLDVEDVEEGEGGGDFQSPWQGASAPDRSGEVIPDPLPPRPAPER